MNFIKIQFYSIQNVDLSLHILECYDLDKQIDTYLEREIDIEMSIQSIHVYITDNIKKVYDQVIQSGICITFLSSPDIEEFKMIN